MTPAAPQKDTRVSADARFAQLREWLIAGHSPEEALQRGLQTWGVRASRLKADLDAILDAWVEDDRKEDPRRALALCKRQRDRLLALAMRQFDAVCDNAPEAARLLKLMDSMMKQRERLARQIAEASQPRPRVRRPHEPLPDELFGPPPAPPPLRDLERPAPTFAAPTPDTEAELDRELRQRFQAAADHVRGLVKNLPPGELEKSLAGQPDAAEVLQILRSEGPVDLPKADGAAAQPPHESAAQAQRKNAKTRRPQKPWPPQADATPKGTFHVPLSITEKNQ